MASCVAFWGLPLCRVLGTLERSRLLLWNLVPRLFPVKCGAWVHAGGGGGYVS